MSSTVFRNMSVQKILLDNDFLFVKSKPLHLTQKDAEEFYKEHTGRFFFNRLISFMSSGPITVHVLARHSAITQWRKLMGPTKVFRAIYESPNSIRGRFGLTDTRNCTHGSDSPESVKKEMAFFFPEINVDFWYQDQEEIFRTKNLFFDENIQEHKPL